MSAKYILPVQTEGKGKAFFGGASIDLFSKLSVTYVYMYVCMYVFLYLESIK